MLVRMTFRLRPQSFPNLKEGERVEGIDGALGNRDGDRLGEVNDSFIGCRDAAENGFHRLIAGSLQVQGEQEVSLRQTIANRPCLEK